MKLPVAEKVERLQTLKEISTRLFKAQKYKKAEKVYRRIDKVFKQKDFRNTFCQEDDRTTIYRDAVETLSNLLLINCTNLAVVCLKQSNLKDALNFCDEALENDHRSIKALYLKGKVLVEMTEFAKAISVLQDLLEIEPDNKDAQALLAKAQSLLK
jgi:tetratricopeptide (TPR) repeat protein